MKRIALAILGAGLAIAGTISWATPSPQSIPTRYRVTITNITKGQIFSPGLVIAHEEDWRLFELGEAAPAGIQPLAEDGDNSLLAGLLSQEPQVRSIRSDVGPLMPGQSTEIVIATTADARWISVAGMLVTTNDAFYAVRGLEAPSTGSRTVRADAYDAGTEFNSERCQYIPGPPCGMGGSHDPADAEGYVFISPGIHGGGDLDPADFDWRTVVAQVRIEPFKN